MPDLQQFFDNSTVKLVKKVGWEKAAELISKYEGRKVSIQEVQLSVINSRAKIDPYYFDEQSLKIRTKQGKLVPLKNTLGQRKLQEAVLRQQKAGKPVRIKLPKSRQFGGSTKTQAIFYRDCHYEEHIQMLTVCHDLDSARNMRAMFERYHDNFPRQKPNFKKVSEKWWKFPQRDIDYLIDTAEELDTGRSFTIHRLHGSEVAFYRDPETLMLGLLQAVPDDPNTIVILESTANGMGGWWYDMVMNDNDYECVFVGWQEIEEYTKPFADDKARIELERSITDYERQLIDTFGITWEQLNWRRYTIDNKLNGDEDKFRQEYPATVEEGFIASGRNYFRVSDIKENLVRAKKHTETIKRGYLEWDKFGESVTFTPDRYGWWKIQVEPEEGFVNRYLTGSDPAEGKDAVKKEGTKSDPDYSVCTVFDRKENRVAARFRARVDTDVFTDEIHKANVYYNSCLEIVELNNNAGGAVIKGLRDIDRINLYRKETTGKVDEVETAEYGYRTAYGAGGTRETLLSDLRRAIKDKRWIDYDEDFWNEALVFVIGKDGKAQAMTTKHDDTIMSAGLVLQGLSQVVEMGEMQKQAEDADVPMDSDVVWEEQTENTPIAEF